MGPADDKRFRLYYRPAFDKISGLRWYGCPSVGAWGVGVEKPLGFGIAVGAGMVVGNECGWRFGCGCGCGRLCEYEVRLLVWLAE